MYMCCNIDGRTCVVTLTTNQGMVELYNWTSFDIDDHNDGVHYSGSSRSVGLLGTDAAPDGFTSVLTASVVTQGSDPEFAAVAKVAAVAVAVDARVAIEEVVRRSAVEGAVVSRVPYVAGDEAVHCSLAVPKRVGRHFRARSLMNQ